MENYVANSQTTFTLDNHKLTVGANFTREELNDRFDVANKTLPGSEPVTKISRNGWALFAEDGWSIDDFILTTSARMDQMITLAHILRRKCTVTGPSAMTGR